MVWTVFLIVLLQALAAGAGLALLWRRQTRLEREVADLRAALAARSASAPAKLRAANMGRVVAFAEPQPAPPAPAPIAPLDALRARIGGWRVDFGAHGGWLHPDALKGVGLALLASAPALGFAFAIDPALIVALGLSVGAFLMLLAARADWPAAGWAALVTATGWAGAGLLLQSAHAAPVLYTSLAAFAAAAGLAYALARRLLPGAALTGAMALALLALGAASDLAGAPGIALGVVASATALVGAHALKLDRLLIGAFATALLGLYVLSGQASAAIWFTPAAAWFGVTFLAIAAVRAPELGARGALVAGLGAIAPLLAIAALHQAQHGLPEARAAAGAYAGTALALAGVIALAATRRGRGVAALGLPLWFMGGSAFTAAAAAIVLAAPAPVAAIAAALMAVSFAVLNRRLPAPAWLAFACLSLVLAALEGAASAALLLREASPWPPFAVISVAIAGPALLAWFGARHAQRAGAGFTAGVFEGLAIVGGVAAANLCVRTVAAEGALMLQPVSFVEASVHIGVWLIAALLLAGRMGQGARTLRATLAYGLGACGLGASALAAVLWLSPYWSARSPGEGLLAQHPLGFALLALACGAHWTLWRGRRNDIATRVSFAAGVLLTACFATLGVIAVRGGPDSVAAFAGALSFAAAIAINFAPGVTAARAREAALD